MSEPSSPRWMHFLMVLGVFALILAAGLPFLLSSHVRNERARRAACERHERIDCDPSVVWLLMK